LLKAFLSALQLRKNSFTPLTLYFQLHSTNFRKNKKLFYYFADWLTPAPEKERFGRNCLFSAFFFLRTRATVFFGVLQYRPGLAAVFFASLATVWVEH
jgi:hypothetical protein